MLRLFAFVLFAALLGLPVRSIDPFARKESPATVAPQERPYEELNYYYNGQQWVPSWFQCDGAGEVAILENSAETKEQRMLRFTRSRPEDRREISFQAGDTDCGMMKCRTTLARGTREKSVYVIQESHYREPEDGFWSNQYQIGHGGSEDDASAHLSQCRWFPRLRVAAITATGTLYITETKAGGLMLKAFRYTQAGAQPAVALTGGRRSSPSDRGLETYTFRQKGSDYVVAVHLNEPGIEIRGGSGEAAKPLQVLAYTYVKKP
jgi:hypothetical protein